MKLLLLIALKHILARKRQSFISLMGIVLGVSFFLAISSLMQGSQKDFIKRLIDNSAHITIVDEYRNPNLQPLQRLYPHGAIIISHVQPLTETRGIRGFKKIVSYLKTLPDVLVSPVLKGQVLASFAGKDVSISLNGMIPEEIGEITTLPQYMVAGSIEEIKINPDGILIGSELAHKLSRAIGDNLNIAATNGQIRVFKVVGIFRTGRSSIDSTETYASLKRVQALLNRSNRANNILIKLADANQAKIFADELEKKFGYKAISWQEASEDLLNTLVIRNIIMYTVVSAVLIVAAFGIYNVISTVVMEKHRDIAILKSMGFFSQDIKYIFLIQGLTLGLTGCLVGLPLGSLLMYGLMQIQFKPPGSSSPINMPLDWGWFQFFIAAVFAIFAALAAAFLPARKAAAVQPIDILRGQI